MRNHEYQGYTLSCACVCQIQQNKLLHLLVLLGIIFAMCVCVYPCTVAQLGQTKLSQPTCFRISHQV